MKLLSCILALSGVFSLQAAQVAKTYAEASQMVKDDGYVLFIYPAGWDQYGEKMSRQLIADESVQAAADDAVLMLAPIYQNRSEEHKKKAAEVMGSLSYPGDMSNISYPAIVFYEKGGRAYATLCGERLMNSDAAGVAAMVQQIMAAKRQQDSLLAGANAATDGAKKARLLLESARVPGIEWPGGIREAIRNADAQDASGSLAALDGAFHFKAEEPLADILKRLDTVLKNSHYTPEQKQRACAAVLGHIRRSMGVLVGGSLISQYAEVMHDLNPDSTLGKAAVVVARDWVREYRYGQGWSPDTIPTKGAAVVMKNIPVQKPGTYTISFKLTDGRDGILVNKMRLMDGKKCVLTLNEPVEINWRATEQSRTFRVRKMLKHPALEMTFGNDSDKRSSWGEITIRSN